MANGPKGAEISKIRHLGPKRRRFSSSGFKMTSFWCTKAFLLTQSTTRRFDLFKKKKYI